METLNFNISAPVSTTATAKVTYTAFENGLTDSYMGKGKETFCTVASGEVLEITTIPGQYEPLALLVSLWDQGKVYTLRANYKGFGKVTDFSSLEKALVRAQVTKTRITLVGCPNSSGAVLPGYFCGVATNKEIEDLRWSLFFYAECDEVYDTDLDLKDRKAGLAFYRKQLSKLVKLAGSQDWIESALERYGQYYGYAKAYLDREEAELQSS